MKMWLFAAAVALAPASTVFAQSPNDAQIASIVVTANQVDIDAGKLAASKTSNADVKHVRAADGHRPHRREQAGDRARHAPEGHP